MQEWNETNPCPICGKSQLEEFDVCPVCGWENDLVQLGKPDFSGGANRMSVIEAQEAYRNGQKVE